MRSHGLSREKNGRPGLVPCPRTSKVPEYMNRGVSEMGKKNDRFLDLIDVSPISPYPPRMRHNDLD